MRRTMALSFIVSAAAFTVTPLKTTPFQRSMSLSMAGTLSQDELKKLVGYKAVDDYVRSGMVVGLGTGSTAYFAVERVGQKLKSGELKDIICIPTSERTKEQALSLGIPLVTLNEKSKLDVAIDGADEVDPGLALVKGGGGALLREKMVEVMSDKFICIVDESKLCKGLGPGFALPVEITPFCHEHTLRVIQSLKSVTGCKAVLRRGNVSNNKADGENISITDNGNYIVDLFFTEMIKDVNAAATELKNTVGVVDHGLFVGMTTAVIVACKDGRIRVAGQGGEAPWCRKSTLIINQNTATTHSDRVLRESAVFTVEKLVCRPYYQNSYARFKILRFARQCNGCPLVLTLHRTLMRPPLHNSHKREVIEGGSSRENVTSVSRKIERWGYAQHSVEVSSELSGLHVWFFVATTKSPYLWAATNSVLKSYLDGVKNTLTSALCLRNFPSQTVERHNKPEVEVRASKELLLNPVTIARSENERCLIEPSINSVRVSIKIKQADEIEEILCHKFTRFLMQRAEQFIVMRRKAVEGYDISFLITHTHLEKMWKHKLIDFIIQFMEEIDKEISSMKIAINARARIVATEFMKQFDN
eukprot:gene5819-11739_t